MKHLIILLAILFTSCSKDALLEPIKPIEIKDEVQIHLQFIEASAILFVDDKIIHCNYMNEHTVIVYSFKQVKSVAIYKTSNGGKITAAIHDYTNRSLYDLGEITSYHKYLLP